MTARSSDFPVPAARFVVSPALPVPVALAIGAVGQWLVGWRPRAAVVILGAATVISYFVQQFAPLFSWPDWVAHLSFFDLYGRPMTTYDWGGTLALIAIAVAGTALAHVSMQRRHRRTLGRLARVHDVHRLDAAVPHDRYH